MNVYETMGRWSMVESRGEGQTWRASLWGVAGLPGFGAENAGSCCFCVHFISSKSVASKKHHRFLGFDSDGQCIEK